MKNCSTNHLGRLSTSDFNIKDRNIKVAEKIIFLKLGDCEEGPSHSKRI